ncbi:glycosyltransferase [Glaciimonas sp. PAMC28666]|uniref:CgeB family protein n=1 Tax=Glaciimonas sp. PAMC28666 TaxID=2807626 RepID=UPI0019649445|nr:glycosyltransferase [Glaciimonas sp. PAMC28666]QRX84562.1 glycosyltransferase [Glaciimonas sp. PAMC28666]
MNILVIGKFYTEDFALHISETFAAMGHAVRRFEPGYKRNRIGGRFGHRLNQVHGVIHSATDSVPEIRARRIKRLWQIADEGPLDLIVVCYDFLWPVEVTELKRRTSAQIVMWFPDAVTNFGKAFFMNAPYDALFFKDPYIVHVLSDVLKSPVYYLPECFNPERHWLQEKDIGQSRDYKCDITTAGNQHSWRVAFYKNLVDYDVKLWGNPAPLWMAAGKVAPMHQGRSVYDQEKVRAFRGAKIVVNNLHYGETWGVNVRCFEAAGAGAFQMVDWKPGLSQLFEDEKELITFRSISDLKQKIDYWLPREAERQSIGEAGMGRAHKDHTYALRLEMMLGTLAGTSDGFPVPQIQYRD